MHVTAMLALTSPVDYVGMRDVATKRFNFCETRPIIGKGVAAHRGALNKRQQALLCNDYHGLTLARVRLFTASNL